MLVTTSNLVFACNLLAAIIYTGAGFYFIARLWRQHRLNRAGLLFVAVIALVFHGVGVYGLSFTAEGFHLSYFGVSSLIFWAVNALILFSSLKKELHNLFLFLYPLSALAVLASLAGANQPTHLLDYSIAAHVVLSLLAYSLLTIASLQAVLVAYQNRQLKARHLTGNTRLLPPLQTMEALLFEILWAGEIMLTLAIMSGFWFLEDMFAQHLVHKTVFSLCAWFIYALLLWGRWRFGWRGSKAIRWALAGFVCLMLAYFGSRLVLELILHRV